MDITLGRLLPLLAQHAGTKYPLMLKMLEMYCSEKAKIAALALTLRNTFHVADKVLIEMGVPPDALAPARKKHQARKTHQGGQATTNWINEAWVKKRLQDAEMAADSLESLAWSALVIAAALTKIATNEKYDS
jgi:short-subunit dehydrogenase involved in D-alanine esterification of teichoic acids